MALEQHAWDVIKQLAPCRLLSLGYPDILIDDDIDVPESANADNMRKWHSWPGKVYDTDALFAKFNITPTYLDFADGKHGEWVTDLNQPIEGYDGYDVILDPGTLEHCFNIGQAFKNVRNLCRPGGTIIHLNPVNWFNHGLWNINPTAYVTWYESHGDELLTKKILGGVPGDRSVYRFIDHLRFVVPEILCTNFVVARRSDQPTAQNWCVQWKYDPNKVDERRAMVRGEIPKSRPEVA